MSNKSAIITLILLLLSLLLASCMPARYGIVLWPTEGSNSEAGELVRVRGVEEQEEQVAIQNSRRDRERLELWRIERFESREEAERFQQRFSSWQSHYARCERRALPIRAQPDRFSEILYRLERGEVTKILDREAEQKDEGSFRDYWYEVISREGIRGWVFGYYLTVFDIESRQVASGTEADANITHFLNNVWRPGYFITMINENKFDLKRFDSAIGLFPAPLERRIVLNTSEAQFFFDYRAPIPTDTNHFSFGEESGEMLVVAMNSPQHITIAFFDDNGRPIETDYYLLDTDIQSIVQQVRADRESRFSEILSSSRRYVNPTYGILQFVGGKNFRWSNNSALSPYLPTGAESGRLAIELTLSDGLATNYDGILSFYFSVSETDPFHFAYRVNNQGLVLSLVLPNTLQGHIATETSREHSNIEMQSE